MMNMDTGFTSSALPIMKRRDRATLKLTAVLLLVALASLIALYEDGDDDITQDYQRHGDDGRRYLSSQEDAMNDILYSNVIAPSECVNELHLENLGPEEINRLRRMLASSNPACYERHFDAFAEQFAMRLTEVKRHLNLHTPKAGGTSFCSLARKNQFDTFDLPSTCFHWKFHYALWCCWGFADRPAMNSCSTGRKLRDFAMNENYLDYPTCPQKRLYSILLRDPVDRAMSQERHYSTLEHTVANKVNATRVGRYNLFRKNYMTWSLTAGLQPTNGPPGEGSARVTFSPKRKDLEVAKEAVEKFDFLLELTRSNDPGGDVPAECKERVLDLMGFNTTDMPHDNVQAGNNYVFEHSREQYEEWNDLDTELYDHARMLSILDCDFFMRLDVAAIERARSIEEEEGLVAIVR